MRLFQDYDKAIDLNPQLGWAFNNNGNILQKMGRTAELMKSLPRLRSWEELTRKFVRNSLSPHRFNSLHSEIENIS
jgi:hypothetical protein